MKIALVGVGFVADYYMTTLYNHPHLSVAGAFDRSPERLRQFCSFYGVRPYPDLATLLADPEPTIVVNLTTPEAHFEVSRDALLAGKHVYTEKPLAMTVDEALALAALADERGLTVTTAPANALSDAQALVAGALARDAIGTPRLAYAEMEDGPVFRDKWATWRSRSGAPWPGVHEFAIGCTLEHAGYAIAWLVSLFGAVETLYGFSAVAFHDKGPGTRDIDMAPDFSVGCLAFNSGMVARLTCGLAAPRDRSLTILGDRGSITVRDLWDDRSVVHLEETGKPTPTTKLIGYLEHRLGRSLPFKPARGRALAYPAPSGKRLPDYPSRIDFSGGIARQAEAIEAGTAPFFSGERAAHVTEIALALNGAGSAAAPYRLRTRPTF